MFHTIPVVFFHPYREQWNNFVWSSPWESFLSASLLLVRRRTLLAQLKNLSDGDGNFFHHKSWWWGSNWAKAKALAGGHTKLDFFWSFWWHLETTSVNIFRIFWPGMEGDVSRGSPGLTVCFLSGELAIYSANVCWLNFQLYQKNTSRIITRQKLYAYIPLGFIFLEITMGENISKFWF